ncbi:MAG: ribosome biogenesis GTPase Der [Deltaproteobacteria bacterium]|nr:ribosome biogenesis GTPase Der [Deltaproteobacteria bacterium]
MTPRRRRGRDQAPPRVGDLPLIAVLGRPNVGKSTLFNRLVGRKTSIVEDRPGVTRDRIYADGDINGLPCTFVDMGGFEFDPEGPVEQGVNLQCRVALEQADVVLFVVDGRVTPTSGDHATADLLRRTETPSVLVINKIDGQRFETEAGDSYSLGLEPVALISALHGRGMSDLEDLVEERLPAPVDSDAEGTIDPAEGGPVRVAIIGRPNTGKSSLVNRLLGEERLLTLDQPGTTRDAVDSAFEHDGNQYILVDTAGIRRKSRVPPRGPERMAVAAAVRAIDRCHVVVMMVDADAGAAEQDTKVLGLAVDRGRAVVLTLNKWDLLEREDERKRKTVEEARRVISFAPWAQLVRISALTGRGLNKLLSAVDAARAQFGKRVPTGELNRLFEDIVEHHPPPLRKGRPVKLFYATQAGVDPPTFVVHCSYPEALHFSYKRYVQNRIRETFGFDGTPLRIAFRKRKRRG